MWTAPRASADRSRSRAGRRQPTEKQTCVESSTESGSSASSSPPAVDPTSDSSSEPTSDSSSPRLSPSLASTRPFPSKSVPSLPPTSTFDDSKNRRTQAAIFGESRCSRSSTAVRRELARPARNTLLSSFRSRTMPRMISSAGNSGSLPPPRRSGQRLLQSRACKSDGDTPYVSACRRKRDPPCSPVN